MEPEYPQDLMDAHALIVREGGQLRYAALLKAGVDAHSVRRLCDAGLVERASRGLYRVTSRPLGVDPDIAVVAARIPEGVLCLLSALAFHGLTTQVPHEIDVAVRRGSWLPRIDGVAVRVFQFGGPAFSEGVEVHDASGITLQVYSAAKTVADLFKFRNRLGVDIALEGLRGYWRSRSRDIDQLIHHARIDRVERVMAPYIEAMQ